MSEASTVKKRILEGQIIERRPDQKSVSYSQYSTYMGCPHHWKLKYKDKMYPFTSTINTVFGTAIHETIQAYLDLLYNHSVKASEEFSFEEYLMEAMYTTYKKEKIDNGGANFVTQAELEEFYDDGIKILHGLRKKRKVLFDYRQEEFICSELELNVPILEGNDKIVFNGFIDLLFYNKEDKMFRMPDLKTSKKGWSDQYEKKDELKLDQIRLYKHFLAKHYGLDISTIEGSYLILKRKIWEDCEFTIPRHTTFIPAQGSAKVKLALQGLESFVKGVFNEDGSYREDVFHKKTTKGGKSCKFCPFAGTIHCDQIDD